MALSALVGPPGSGRTHALLARARAACDEGLRVWWVGLPAQRASLYRRATLPAGADAAEQPRALLGLEFLTFQQLYYRMLARARELRPLLIGSGRLVLVGEAVAEVGGAVPAPGEARLFAQAIAEAKRFGVGPEALRRAGDPERERLARVYAAYERRKRLDGEVWDYDDFRGAALALAERAPDSCEAELLVVDGFRELGPLELRLLQALGRQREVHLSLPELPPGAALPVPARASGGLPVEVERYRAPNPVAEARWVLRSLKRDLAAGGYDPLDLAVIAPQERRPALEALADEYGVPLVDETPRALADAPAGRSLVELLELPDHPTASGLLAVPELAELADAALDAGIAGAEAMALLAERLGLDESYHRWLSRLEVGAEPLAWARQVLAEALPAALAGAPEGVDDGLGGFQRAALAAAQEASRLASGSAFRAWWAALLRLAGLPRDVPGGVALLSATLASGRRFRKAYLLGAVEGAYGSGEREDYFVPEDDRSDLETTFERLGLPRRFQGRDQAAFEELLARADRLVVTVPEADQGGPLIAEPLLAGGAPPPLPEVPAGSRLELAAGEPYRPLPGKVELGAPTLEALRRFDECSLRYWGERRLSADRDRAPWWVELRRALRASGTLTEERLTELAAAFPLAAAWLRQQRERLVPLRFGVRLPTSGEGARAVLDAAVRDGGRARLVRFAAPDAPADAESAERTVKERWTELWAAGHLLRRYPKQVTRVDVWLWPLLAEPVDVFPRGITYPWRQIGTRERRARSAYERFSLGEATPRPGFQCRSCPVADVCREGRRA